MGGDNDAGSAMLGPILPQLSQWFGTGSTPTPTPTATPRPSESGEFENLAEALRRLQIMNDQMQQGYAERQTPGF